MFAMRREGQPHLFQLKPRHLGFHEFSYIRPGILRPCVTRPISWLEISLAWPMALLTALMSISSRICASFGLRAAGSILMEATVPSHLATTLTAPPPLVASTVLAARED